MLGLMNRGALPAPTEDDLDRLIAELTAILFVNHTETGTHDVRSSGFDLVPVGAVMLWMLAVPPDSWVFCNGQLLNRTQYALLFKVLGTTFGAGNGSTTFQIPTIAPAHGGSYIICTGVGGAR